MGPGSLLGFSGLCAALRRGASRKEAGKEETEEVSAATIYCLSTRSRLCVYISSYTITNISPLYIYTDVIYGRHRTRADKTRLAGKDALSLAALCWSCLLGRGASPQDKFATNVDVDN